MGLVSLHLDKSSGDESGMTAHIERTQIPSNADPNRTHLNRELIEFPEGVKNRTEAIQHRLDHAGITRKIGKNQVRVIRAMLSGTHEDMKRIESEGRLDEWCRDNVAWLRKTYGAENVVSVVLHLDETTPHLHATVVPIVTGERRKVREGKVVPGKKKYRTKNPSQPRLCADDVMNRAKLKEYQDTYAVAMSKYGLERGVEGSQARHISTQEFYRKEAVRQKQLKESIEGLEQKKQKVREKVFELFEWKHEVRDDFLDMDRFAQQKKKELADLQIRFEQIRQEYEPYQAQEELSKIYTFFPMVKERMDMVKLCEGVGLGIESIRALFRGKTLTAESATLYSPEHKRPFEAKNAELRIEKEPDNPAKLRLSLNGQNILDWFRKKHKELSEKWGRKLPSQKSKPKIRW